MNNDPLVNLDDATQAAMCLAMVSGVGPRNYQSLIDALGSPREVLQTAPSILRDIPGIGTKLARAISLATGTIDVAGEIQRCRDANINTLTIGQREYPTRLLEIVDPPALMYICGELIPQDELAIAIVGSRHATQYGVRQAERFARGLARTGITVVSGLARGIDAAAHRGALAGGGRTLAILGSGLLNLYPPEHGALAKEIVRDGALLSEFPTLQAPKSSAFPRRNRIVSGISLGVIVIEAAERSGALISARHASEQGREVFALPGSIESRNSRGCHRLIRDGAKLVETIDDVFEELGPLATSMKENDQNTIRHPVELVLNEMERQILNSIDATPTLIDDIVVATGLPVHRVLSTVSVLEMRHLVRRASGSSLCRC